MASTRVRGQSVALFVVAACAMGAAIVVVRRRTPPRIDVPVAAAASAPASGPEDDPADWCAPGFVPIRGGACFAAAGATPPARLIVYLHGRYPRDAVSEEVDRQRRLAVQASARGFAVVALRGRLGTCSAPELATWYCWPSNDSNADAGPAFVDTWAVALAAAHEQTGSRQRFLFGFSNGGYFAGLVASRGLLEINAAVVAHGGPVEPVHALHTMPPLLLLSADDDVAQDDMIRFDAELTREHWAHDSYARTGGHGLTDQDIDAALTFFTRAGEPLPLQPPLALHRAVPHVRDAGAEEPSRPDETAPEGGAADEAVASAEDPAHDPSSAAASADPPNDPGSDP